MIYISIIIGCILGAIIGMNAPVISYTYSSYLAIAIIAALDTVFGGITSVLNKNFDLKIFLSGFFDIYLAAVVVFVGRMFTNLAIIRRHYVDKWTNKFEQMSLKIKEVNSVEKKDAK